MRTAGQGTDGFEKRQGFMTPGQDIVMAGCTGFSGTQIIAEEKMDILREHFAPGFLRCLLEKEHYSIEQWMKGELEAGNSPVSAYEIAGEGGIFAALWNLSGIYGAGIEIDLRLLPMKQITVEVCELFEVNPYRLYSGNSLLLTTEAGGKLVRRLKREGIPAEVVGRVTGGIARRIRHGEDSYGYLERPQPDELAKLGIPVSPILKPEAGYV